MGDGLDFYHPGPVCEVRVEVHIGNVNPTDVPDGDHDRNPVAPVVDQVRW